MRSLSITKQFVFEDFKEMAWDTDGMMMQMRARRIVYYNFFHNKFSGELPPPSAPECSDLKHQRTQAELQKLSGPNNLTSMMLPWNTGMYTNPA